MTTSPVLRGALAACLCAAVVAAPVLAQTPPAPAAAAPAAAAAEPANPLAPFAWLEGCWRGAVNQREFREHWLPPRGGLMVGASHIVMGDKTLGYEYLRLEPRADGVYYVTLAGTKEIAYRYTGATTDKTDTIFTFANPAQEFPQTISYRQGTEGWLYATVEGKVNGAERSIIYPMRRIGCESGELIKK